MKECFASSKAFYLSVSFLFRAKSWCHGHGDNDDDDDEDSNENGLNDVLSCCAQTFWGGPGPTRTNFFGGECELGQGQGLGTRRQWHSRSPPSLTIMIWQNPILGLILPYRAK